MVVGPLMYWGLIRLHREYVAESQQLEVGAARAVVRADPPPPRRRRPRRPPRHGDRPGHPVRPDAVARRPAGRPLRHRQPRSPRAPGGVAPARSQPAAAGRRSSAPTGGSRGPPSSWWPTRWSTATRSARCCCPGGRSPSAGSGCCTTGRPTRSRPSSARCRTCAATIVPYNVGGRWAERGRRYRKVVEAAAATAVAEGTDAAATGRWATDDREREGGPTAATSLRPTKVDQAPSAAAPASAPAGRRDRGRERDRAKERSKEPASAVDRALAERATNTQPIGDARFRERVRVAGRVKSVRVQPAGRDLQPRVPARRPFRRAAPRLPGPAEDPGDRAGRPPGRRGDGRGLGPPLGHLEPRLRAGRRARPGPDRRPAD